MGYFNYHNGEINEAAGRGRILGQFKEKEHGFTFQFSVNTDKLYFCKNFPHKIAIENGDSFRYAMVGKTVAYIVIDEDALGNPVIQKWFLKSHRLYPV